MSGAPRRNPPKRPSQLTTGNDLRRMGPPSPFSPPPSSPPPPRPNHRSSMRRDRSSVMRGGESPRRAPPNRPSVGSIGSRGRASASSIGSATDRRRPQRTKCSLKTPDTPTLLSETCGGCPNGIFTTEAAMVVTTLAGTKVRFHRDHFLCARCGENLRTQPWSETENGTFVCGPCLDQEHCHGECAACGLPIKDTATTALDKLWHVSCFVCWHCKCDLESFAEGKDGKPYCIEHYHSLFSEKCHSCSKPIISKQLNALGNKYHPECLTCSSGNHQLDVKAFYSIGEKLFCVQHYEKMMLPQCDLCDLPIKGPYSNRNGFDYHIECLQWADQNDDAPEMPGKSRPRVERVSLSDDLPPIPTEAEMEVHADELRQDMAKDRSAESRIEAQERALDLAIEAAAQEDLVIAIADYDSDSGNDYEFDLPDLPPYESDPDSERPPDTVPPSPPDSPISTCSMSSIPPPPSDDPGTSGELTPVGTVSPMLSASALANRQRDNSQSFTRRHAPSGAQRHSRGRRPISVHDLNWAVAEALKEKRDSESSDKDNEQPSSEHSSLINGSSILSRAAAYSRSRQASRRESRESKNSREPATQRVRPRRGPKWRGASQVYNMVHASTEKVRRAAAGKLPWANLELAPVEPKVAVDSESVARQAALKAAKARLDLIKQNGVKRSHQEPKLTLRQVMAALPYREVLAEYLDKNLCGENLRFMTAVLNYTREASDIPKNNEEAAMRIWKTFLHPKEAVFLVNIDARTHNNIKRRLETNDFSRDLYDEAHGVIYVMTSRDVFGRFVKDKEYARMQKDLPWGMQAFVRRRRRCSFAILRNYEDYQLLDRLAISILIPGRGAQTRMVRLKLKKYQNCIEGNGLVDFLTKNLHAKTRLDAMVLLQRMLEVGLLKPIISSGANSGELFSDNFDVYRVRMQREIGRRWPKVSALLKQKTSLYGNLVYKGVRYHNSWGIFSPDMMKLFVFRNKQGSPLLAVNLQGAYLCFNKALRTQSTFGDKDEGVRDADNFMFTICYLQIMETSGNMYTFCLAPGDSNRWEQVLASARCPISRKEWPMG